jgi:Helix-turn-helix domain
MSPHRCYTVADLLTILKMSRRTFFTLWKAGRLPYLEELKPRSGRLVRFRADLVDRYLANEWRTRPVAAARKIAS